MPLMRITIISLALVVAAGCSDSSSDTSTSSESSETTQAAAVEESVSDFAGLVDIGGGRKIYMECQGKGSPTGVFLSGGADRAETWSKTDDPSQQAVLPAIAETNRVCAYDRPGTILATGEGIEDFEPSRSDPVPQPTTLQDGARDLHALLSASGERGPYVVVGHSLGGAIAKLYASEYPREVSGLVLVDYLPYQARNALTDDEWELWKNPLLGSASEEALAIYPDLEQNDNQQNFEQDSAADALKPMPLIVLRSDEPFDFTPLLEDGSLPMTVEQAKEFLEVLRRAWGNAVAAVVRSVPGARVITETHSGHYIHWEQPQLVTDSVREVVEAARKKSCALGVKNHGQCIKAEKHARQ